MKKHITYEMIVELCVSIIIIALFFFPWLKVNALFYSKEITGLRMFSDLGDLLSFTGDEWVKYILPAFYLIPLLALTNAVLFIIRDEARMRGFFIGLCILTVFELAILLVVCLSAYSNFTSFGIAFGLTLLLAMTGLIFTFICGWIKNGSFT